MGALSKLPLEYIAPDTWKYPIDLEVDYRKPENRFYLMKAWVEALAYTEEHNQQMRLMDYWIEKDHAGSVEMKIWLSFLWGCCYNSIGPWTILNEFTTPPRTPEELQAFADWYNKNFDRMRFDTDCRYRKSKMIACVNSYVEWLGDRTQFEAFEPMMIKEDSFERFTLLWETSNSFAYFGRLSSWNFLEALNIVFGNSYEIDVPSFMLRDVSGSESNRNGAAFLTNREDLLTKHGKLYATGCTIEPEDCDLLEIDLERAFKECVEEFGEITFINRLNFETSGACWLKKFFREKNSRYIGWDAERTYEEIRYMEENWPEYSCEPLWEARKVWLPETLLCELSETADKGVKKKKMGYFYHTGTPLHIWHLQNGTRWEEYSLPGQKELSLFDF